MLVNVQPYKDEIVAFRDNQERHIADIYKIGKYHLSAINNV